MKAFCLMTVGRCGSTALMKALGNFPDIAVPSCDLECDDEELLHPDHAARYARHYSRLTGMHICTPAQLMRAFCSRNEHQAFAGFKSMPNRHRKFDSFVRRADIQFISLVRHDIPSTVASFLTAMQFGCWRRSGEPQSQKWIFEPDLHGPALKANLNYITSSIRQIKSMPSAIDLYFEDLCQEDFKDQRLADFFSRPIKVQSPRPPVHGSSYVHNWQEFVEYLDQHKLSPT